MSDQLRITNIRLTDTAIWVKTDDGREACENYADYERLRGATPEQLSDYTADKYGIHWNQLDEDLSFEGFFRPKHHTTLYDLFLRHPELNASAIARRAGIGQGLFAQYVSGGRRPSDEHMQAIRDAIASAGRELQSAAETLL